MASNCPKWDVDNRQCGYAAEPAGDGGNVPIRNCEGCVGKCPIPSMDNYVVLQRDIPLAQRLESHPKLRLDSI